LVFLTRRIVLTKNEIIPIKTVLFLDGKEKIKNIKRIFSTPFNKAEFIDLDKVNAILYVSNVCSVEKDWLDVYMNLKKMKY